MNWVPLVLVAVMSEATAATGYDFFGRARYPGPTRVEGVDLYKVAQQGGPHAEGYKRRVVHWWPRRGVDLIEVEEGMPLRTWTLRQRRDMRVQTDWLTRQLAADQPLQFKAHLVGFRGIGNRYANPFRANAKDDDFICPALVLRLADGRKRCFTRGTFIEEDEKYVLDLYLKEMERIRRTLKKVKYQIRPSLHIQWPNNAKPGEPGTMQVVSERVMFVSGSQSPPSDPNNPWVSSASPQKARRYREGSVTCAEDFWAYNEYAGSLMPYWDRTRQFKYTVKVCGTYRDGYQWIPGYAGGGYGNCGLKHAGGGPWSAGLFHEWVHGHAAARWRVGGGEIQADAGQTIADPGILNFGNNISRPWRCCVHGAYKTCLFYAIMSEDPNWGYAMALTVPGGAGEQTVFQTLARLGEQRGLFDNGIRGVGDMVGEFSARIAELDCELQGVLRRGVVAVKRNRLEPVDRKAGWYRIFREEAPEPFGSNVIRLVLEEGAKQIRVDFRGLYDPDTYGDWRACIVAVGADGRARYSPLWNQGVMTMAIQPGDRRHWLTVAATPWAFCVPDASRGATDIAAMYYGRHAPRYPYEVKLTGCRPGTPHAQPGDTDDYDLVHAGGRWHLCKVPHAGDTPEAQRMRKDLAQLEARLQAFAAAANKQIEDGQRNAKDWHTRNMLRILGDQQQRIRRVRDGLKGARHANGGGWVAGSAEVADTAYVGPDAMVLDGARVLDNAVVEGFAVVSGPKVVVSGNARLSGQAHVSGNVAIGGHARVWHQTSGRGDETLVAPEMPLRFGQTRPDPWKLWANYSLDREEKLVLEDWSRFHAGIYRFHELSLDGTLHGRPRFVVDDQRRGFQFNGRTQYAEAASTLADLGQITVDIALKWAGGSGQVLFDFGSSAHNRFVLHAAGKSGRPELVVTRGGETERVVAASALPRNQWTRCRVEIDGRQLALWIAGRRVGQRASNFRPCDAFPPDAEKRNFIAAARDRSGYFNGTLDFVRVYYTVHEDFDRVPEPRRHSPRRVSGEFIECVKKQTGNVDQIRRQVDQRFKKDYQFYAALRKGIDARMLEIRESTPRAVRARQQLDQAKQALAARGKELQAEFDGKAETAARRSKLSSQRKTLEDHKRELLNELLAGDKTYGEAKKAAERGRAQMARLDGSFRSRPKMRELNDRVGKLAAQIREGMNRIARQEDLARQRQEIDGIRRQRSKLEQEIRRHPELKALQGAQQNRQFADRLRQLRDANPEIIRLRQLEREKNDAYRRVLRERCDKDPQLQKLVVQRDSARSEIATRLDALRAADSQYAAAADQYKTASEVCRRRPRELETRTPAIARLNRQISRIRQEEREISEMRQLHVARRTVDLTRQVAVAEKAYAEATTRAAEAYAPEFRWLQSISRAAFSGYYNTPYNRYLRDRIRLEVSGGEDDGVVENLATLKRLHASQQPGAWQTRCDWEWRTRWELDGSIAQFPLLREWLERVRGDVVVTPEK